MKKHLLYIAAICGAIMNSSCSTEDNPIKIPDEISIFELPEYSDKATEFVIQEGKIVADGASLTAINFTESGKAIIEVTKGGRVHYVTYNASITEDGSLSITDVNGNKVGSIPSVFSRSSENTKITVDLTVIIDGKTYYFKATDPVDVLKSVQSLVGSNSKNTNNVARTWKVASMNIVIEGDVEVSMLERSGNLKVFADAAIDAGAKLTADEYRVLSKTINSITLDKNGLFSIEYTDNSSDACTWRWTNDKQMEFLLEPRKNPQFGNKFVPLNSKITVNFAQSNIVLTLKTDITGSEKYKVTLTFVLK